MKILRTVFIALFLVLLQHSGTAQATDSLRVLFVGNSYTYFWNLPQHISLMAESQDLCIEVFQSTAGGANLGEHWRSEKDLNTIKKIESGNYDIVILQDHSLRAIDHPDSLIYYGHLLDDVIRTSGAQPLLYMTWARKWDPYMQKQITEQYKKLGELINARTAPVGLAWRRARELRPDLELYDSDGSHPSALGTYLTACVFYGILTRQTPVGLPNRLITKDENGEKIYINIQSVGDVLFGQKVAEEVLGLTPTNKKID